MSAFAIAAWRPFVRRPLLGFPSQNECGDNADEKEADDLDEHVSGDVALGKAVPIPIGNIGSDCRQDSCARRQK